MALTLEIGRRFPVRHTTRSLPWRLVEQHSVQAERNLGQTLEAIAQGGGLKWDELAAVLEDRSYSPLPCALAAGAVMAAVEAYRLRQLCEATETVLLFHSGGAWDDAKRARWEALTGCAEASTRTLCDYLRGIRERIAAEQPP